MERPSEVAQGALVDSLRQVFKQKRITYADAAAATGVSEQTIKRFFAGDDFPVSRLMELCELAKISFFDLAAIAKQGEGEISFQLTPEQEEFFASHPHFFLFFNELRAEKTAAQIASENGLSKASLARYLKDLESLGLIERGAGTSAKLLVKGGLNLRKGGPLSHWISMDFATRMLTWVRENVNDTDPQKIKIWTMSDALLSPESIAEMRRELEDLAARYRKLSYREEKILSKEKLRPVVWLVAAASPYEHKFREKIIEI